MIGARHCRLPKCLALQGKQGSGRLSGPVMHMQVRTQRSLTALYCLLLHLPADVPAGLSAKRDTRRPSRSRWRGRVTGDIRPCLSAHQTRHGRRVRACKRSAIAELPALILLLAHMRVRVVGVPVPYRWRARAMLGGRWRSQLQGSVSCCAVAARDRGKGMGRSRGKWQSASSLRSIALLSAYDLRANVPVRGRRRCNAPRESIPSHLPKKTQSLRPWIPCSLLVLSWRPVATIDRALICIERRLFMAPGHVILVIISTDGSRRGIGKCTAARRQAERYAGPLFKSSVYKALC